MAQKVFSIAQPRAGKPVNDRRLVGGGLGGGRKHAVQAEVHGLGRVVVAPGVRENEDGAGASNILPLEKRDGLGEVRIVDFGEGRGAEVERILEGSDELVLGVSLRELRGFRRSDTGDFGAEIVIGLGDMQGEMSKGDLVRSGLEREFIGGHGVGSRDHSFGIAGETVPEGVGDGRS